MLIIQNHGPNLTVASLAKLDSPICGVPLYNSLIPLEVRGVIAEYKVYVYLARSRLSHLNWT